VVTYFLYLAQSRETLASGCWGRVIPQQEQVRPFPQSYLKIAAFDHVLFHHVQPILAIHPLPAFAQKPRTRIYFSFFPLLLGSFGICINSTHI
jgi:hypothetical protein